VNSSTTGFESPTTTTEWSREVWFLYDLMCSSPLTQPDAYTVTTMLDICRTSNEVVILLEDVLDRGKVPLESAVLRSAIGALGQVGVPSSSCVLFANHVPLPLQYDGALWQRVTGSPGQGNLVRCWQGCEYEVGFCQGANEANGSSSITIPKQSA
jgi:hypothetical protein